MRVFVRIVIIAALVWLAMVLFMGVHELEKHTMDADGNPIQENEVKVMYYFGGITLVVISIGVVVALSLIPAIGDRVGAFFYNPNEQIEANPHADALACMAQGDYGGAIKDYFKAYDKNPLDTHAISEIAHIYCDKLEDDVAASATLEEVLKKEWPDEDSVFLRNRLVDIYWNYQKDAIRSREILIDIAENMPETKYAANAQHRLLEIDRALSSEEFAHAPQAAPQATPQEPEESDREI